MPYDNIVMHLRKHKRKTIELVQIKTFMGGGVSEQDFVCAINKLSAERVLIAMGNSADKNGLSFKYSIDKAVLNKAKVKSIHMADLSYHPLINMSYYYNKTEEFKDDKRYIDLIDEYIIKNSLPNHSHLPDLSLALVGDEKWIEYKGGMKVLQRIGLWDLFAADKAPNPLAFSVNLKFLQNQSHKDFNKHLIVENKSIFLHLMDVLPNTDYLSVIYGQGYGICSSIKNFEKQLNTGKENEYDYFGDVDMAGIDIFYSLSKQVDLTPHKGLYSKLVAKAPYSGKENQRCSNKALEAFFCKIPALKNRVNSALESQKYWPQEALSLDDLRLALSQNARI